MSPTHNLKIVVLDADDAETENAEIVDFVYRNFAGVQFRREVHWRDTKMPGFVCWTTRSLSSVEARFMGDLFTTAIHSDALLYAFTKHILSEIEQDASRAFSRDIKIEFHIFRYLDEYTKDYAFHPPAGESLIPE